MKKYAKAFLKHLTTVLEYIIAALLAGGIIIMIFQVLASFNHLTDFSTYPNYEDLLTVCFNLIIGVEMIRMLYLHTPMTVFEVLLFAIARQIIIDHSSPVNSLLGVIAIAILFATRKFLFVVFDESEKTIFRATQKVRHINRLIHVNIPYENDETLLDVITKKLKEDETELGIGACTYFSDFGLRVAKMTDGKITRIEVIRSIH
ncbi:MULTISPECIES: transporter [Mediterraneibacter]|uniref:transporter n=1 Tax=Mediterraneibacter TaxID=2316020 RepID=UPI0024ACCBB8|nr:transporter [Mediterraneibacter massiliensis]